MRLEKSTEGRHKGQKMNIKSFIRGDSTLNASQNRSREVFFYLIFGGLTTLVNLASFFIFDKIFGTRPFYVTLGGFHFELIDSINNTVAWILAVLFAFITNRTIVFRSEGPLVKELFSFVTSRIATLLVFELGTFGLCILFLENGLGIRKTAVLFSVGTITFTYKYIVKLVNSLVFVVTGNYILSKLFVFAKAPAAPAAVKASAVTADEAGKPDITKHKECDTDSER